MGVQIEISSKSSCRFGLDIGRYIPEGKKYGPRENTKEKVEWVELLYYYNFLSFDILEEDSEKKDFYTCGILRRVGHCERCPAYTGSNKR